MVWLWSQILRDVQRGRRLSAEAEEIEIFLQTGADCCSAITCQVTAKQRDGLGTLAAGQEHLRFDFYGGSEGVWQMWLGVELALQELLTGLSFDPLGIVLGAVGLIAVQIATGQPGKSVQVLGRLSVLNEVRLERAFGPVQTILNNSGVNIFCDSSRAQRHDSQKKTYRGEREEEP